VISLNAAKDLAPALISPLPCSPFTLQVNGGQLQSAPCNNPALPAVQAADPCDYRISPGSFVTSLPLRIGDGCCEAIVPSVLPVQQYTFRRVATMPAATVSRPGAGGPGLPPPGSVDPISVVSEPDPPATSISFGEILEYQQKWFAIGHSLGEIRYSLALAPGEAVDIAVVDWSRQDQASRTDSITATEYLANQLNRDRSIGETISSLLDETQDGWSLMGGTAGDSSYQYGTFKIAGDHSIGGAIAHSSGDRNLQADSLQSLNDQTNQTTATLRTLNSTTVMQATQAEQNVLRTRRVANHNHCHALTIEYYEVLRQYRLVTVFAARRKAVLIPFAPFSFDWKITLRFRPLLVPNLLDPSLEANFDAILRYNFGTALYPANQTAGSTTAAPTSQYFTGTKTVVVAGNMPTSAVNFGVGLVQKGSRIATIATAGITQAVKFGIGDPNSYDADGIGAPADTSCYAPGKNQNSLVCRLGGVWYQGGMNAEFVSTSDDDFLLLQPNDVMGKLGDNSGAWTVDVTVTAPAPSGGPPAPTPISTGPVTPAGLTPEGDAFAQAVLLQHLNDNRGYYNRVVWLTMDASDLRMFVDSALASYPSLSAGIDTPPLAVSGNILAFPFDGAVPGWTDQKPADVTDPIESIVTLPTRGVFAEAMLGHCNACEMRDVTRMWDWTEMTEEEPPPISDVTPGPRGTATSITPDTLPQNVIQISQPPAAPDPTGLAAALRVIGTPGIFRDDTGLQQVSTLLGTLANGAVTTLTGAQKVAQQAQQQLQAIQAGQGQAGSGSSGTTQQRPTAAQTYDNLTAAKQIAAAAKDLGWSPQTTEAVTSDLVSGGTVTSSPASQASMQDNLMSGIDLETYCTPAVRAFGPADFVAGKAADRSGVATLRAVVGDAPAGSTWLWKPASATAVQIDNPTNQIVSVTAGDPGVTRIAFQALDAGGAILATSSIQLCVPQFVVVGEDELGFTSELTNYHLDDVKEAVLRTAKSVVDFLLAKANVRTIWTLPPFNDTLPAQLAPGGFADGKFNALTISGTNVVDPLTAGETPPPVGPAIFNEAIAIYPAAFGEPGSEVGAEVTTIVEKIASLDMTDPQIKGIWIEIMGRLIGETMAHEIFHSILGNAGFDAKGHNALPIPFDIMNRGPSRNFLQRTGIEIVDPANFPSPGSYVDGGIFTIGGLQAENQAKVDAVFPVPPAFP
jgi:hypothetical protein